MPEAAGSVFTEAPDLVRALFASLGLATFGVLLFAVGVRITRSIAKPRPAEFHRTWAGFDLLMAVAIYLASSIVIGATWVLTLGVQSLEQALPALILTAIAGLSVVGFLLLRAHTLRLNLGWFGFGAGDHLRSVMIGVVTYVTGLPLLLGLMGVWSVMLQALGHADGQDVVVMIQSAAREDLIPIAILAALVVPWVEEMFFRGILFSYMHKVGGPYTAVIVSSVFFAIIHGFVASGPILALALMLAFARLHSRGILACFVIHAMHNGIQVAVLQFLIP